MNFLDTETVNLKEKINGDLNALCSDSNYITHYTASHKDFSSLVIVVVWKSNIPGLFVVYDGLPLLYVHHASPAEDFNDWKELEQNNPPIQKLGEYTVDQLQDAIEIKKAIEKHYESLFKSHSNLVAIRPSDQLNGTQVIEFIVFAKNFIPSIDKTPLPRDLDGIPTRVSSGWVELCGRSEQSYHRPIRPGAGFAVGADAELNLDVPLENYNPPVIGTIGGLYRGKDGHTYGVTCGHCIRVNTHSNDLQPTGSSIFQPCAMGLIINAASSIPGLLDAYDSHIHIKGYMGAMTWMLNNIQQYDINFTATLPLDSKCGDVHGGVLGPLNINDGLSVDVGLVKLSVLSAPECGPSLKFSHLLSPQLYLEGEDTSKILKLDEFPRRKFDVYGRGARSIDTMRATVNPLQTEIYFRTLTLDGLVFKCIHAETDGNWNPGDSGTWCWTEDSKLVGMGMGYAHVGRVHYCCMLPMTEVVASIQYLIDNAH